MTHKNTSSNSSRWHTTSHHTYRKKLKLHHCTKMRISISFLWFSNHFLIIICFVFFFFRWFLFLCFLKVCRFFFFYQNKITLFSWILDSKKIIQINNFFWNIFQFLFFEYSFDIIFFSWIISWIFHIFLKYFLTFLLIFSLLCFRFPFFGGVANGRGGVMQEVFTAIQDGNSCEESFHCQ